MGKDVFFIILISLIDLCVITYICYKHGMLLFDISSIMKIGQIIFLGILSQCFLSSKLYRHHIVAQIFIGVGIILLSFFPILNGIIIQDFNPSYLAIGDSIGVMITWLFFNILYFIESHKMDVLSYTLIGLFILSVLLINCLVYTELLIINAFGLKYYTKVEISKRADKEIVNKDKLLSLSDFESEDGNENSEDY